MSDVRRERLARSRLYFVTDLRPDLDALLAAALEGGVDMVQLRDKERATRSSWPRPASSGAAATNTTRSSG